MINTGGQILLFAIISRHVFGSPSLPVGVMWPGVNMMAQPPCIGKMYIYFWLGHCFREYQVNQERLEFNGRNQLLDCTADINLFGERINDIKKKTETLLDTVERKLV
jgi:hypothetical protein